MNLITNASVSYVLKHMMPDYCASSNIAYMSFDNAVSTVLNNRNTIEYWFKSGTSKNVIDYIKNAISSDKKLVPSFSNKMEEGSVILCEVNELSDSFCVVITIGRMSPI